MTKIFRRSRVRNILEKRIGKYLLYAAGEILLVVIGILIAFGLNSWNLTRKAHKEEIRMLEGLHQQLSEDLSNLRENIANTEARRERVIRILELLQDPKYIDLEEFAILQLDLTEDDYFVSQRAIFDEAVSSGKLNLIRNERLRQNIFQYYNVISNDRDNDKLQYKITNELVMPIMVQEVASTKDYINFFSKAKGYNIDSKIPKLDLVALSKSTKYHQAVIYAMNDEYQVKDWKRYATLANSLLRAISFELKDYGIDIAAKK